MPSLRDVAHDGVFCVHLLGYRPAPGQVVWSARAGGMDHPSRTKSHPGWSLSSSQPGEPPCWASPLACGFGLTLKQLLLQNPKQVDRLLSTDGINVSVFIDTSVKFLTCIEGFDIHLQLTYQESLKGIVRWCFSTFSYQCLLLRNKLLVSKPAWTSKFLWIFLSN